MTVVEKLKNLPPLPDRGAVDAAMQNQDVVALARTVQALAARNELLCSTLVNFCEAWELLRGEYPAELSSILKECRIA